MSAECGVRNAERGTRNAECGIRDSGTVVQSPGDVSLIPVFVLDTPHSAFRVPRFSLTPRSAFRARSSGFTLVEVLLASLILGIGLTVLLSSLSVCLRTMRLAHDYERAQWVLGLGELTYPEPLQPSTDVKEDYTVDADASLVEGYVFARAVDDKKEEDKEKNPLYIVHVRVGWGEGSGDEQAHEELVRYVWERPK